MEKALSEEETGGAEAPCLTLVYLGSMHQLNLVGAEVWKLCDGTLGVGEIVDELLPRFSVDRGELAEDVNAFVEGLLAQGMLVREA